MAGDVRIGTSGWVYPHWRGRFYPTDLGQTKWLAYYAERFDTVELNNPFYRQPERAAFERWRRAVPDRFVYAVKLNRFASPVREHWMFEAAVSFESVDTPGNGTGQRAAL